ncbi:exodeoxyribonuclease VII large subunit [Dasania sp. GY-MA-18]|uniref:Exodeoxyribonuclease 7 large subunit n=1 Tax=Dasania phycosphaerae TaxID=2950436 RepID=A0A9J6RLV6_9GAMM|nr:MULTISPECIES: exodeoxyribonuclease VII large subunit [Dasania]MCR8922745.1 exodeoxyribonuclease VII large subunit [Dasania sp. GY-MA-18]MCZ0865175.1 exodeoxyribonuclease VII large subunit [Dasania phycosphaerae]MCZ0868901.1 exodeoxyribonuclease VII large subunit [Dasania phycosphaerae]
MLTPQAPQNNRTVLSVGQLNRQAKRLLESQFPNVWIEGEISNLSRPSSGHWYFSLKDASAQVRCAMFRGNNLRLRFQPQAGQKVVIRAKLSLYEARGDYQLIAEYMEPAGAGDLARAFEELKARLNLEGLFDPSIKQPLPEHPKHIVVITSPTGAAIRDILTVLKRRHAGIQVTILPVAVQGNEAAGQIARAIHTANHLVNSQQADFDVILLGRGGGSQEDLWAFNEEIVARAIAASELPLVSAVGHETDFTIADFCADLRAATPSAAAELLSPDLSEQIATIAGYQQWLISFIQQRLSQQQQQLGWLSSRLRHPGSRLAEQQQRLDELDIRLQQAWQKNRNHNQHRAELLRIRLQGCQPHGLIRSLRQHSLSLLKQLKQLHSQQLQRQQQQLKSTMQRLHTVSPLATLDRGYAIVTDHSGQVVTNAQQLQAGDELNARLSKGEVNCVVKAVKTGR